MTGEGERRTGAVAERGEERPGEREAPAQEATERNPGRVPEPSPEEAPELLGETSDYPIAWDGGER